MRVNTSETDLVVIDESRKSVSVTFPTEPEIEDTSSRLGPFSDVGYAPETGARRHTVTDELRTSPVAVTVIDLTAETPDHHHLAEGESARLDADTGVVIRTPILLHVRPTSGGVVRRTAEETVVELDGRSRVDLGFESRQRLPRRTIRTERSLEGIARGLTALGCAAETTTTPDRSFPNARRAPPRLEFSQPVRQNVERFEAERPDTDTEIVVPETDGLAHLLPTAGLLHYLAAAATVEEGLDEAYLRAGETTFPLGATPAATDEAASAYLRTVFYLDCLARTGGPYGTELAERELLDELGLDATELYETEMAERVCQYLQTTGVGECSAGESPSKTAFLDELPEWHLGIHVEPTERRVPALSHYLSRLADVYSPSSATLTTLADRNEWAARTTRSESAQTSDDVMVSPADRARTVGWYAPRRALGAFNVVGDGLPRKYPLAEGDLSITVVIASPEFAGESVAEYRERDLPLSVRVLSEPGKDELREAFETPTDLLHYVGHHESSGLRCRDGTLSAFGIDCQVEAFFLNACGSISFGEELIKQGASAGAVTTRAVFDESATAVGCNWARLMSYGWSVARALSVARRVDDPSGYVAVGDGTHIVTQSDTGVPPEIRLSETDGSGESTLSLSYNAPREAGMFMDDDLPGSSHLVHTLRRYDTAQPGVTEMLYYFDSPVRCGDQLFWDHDEVV